ncbi:hypothetical protein [Mycolicibacterium mageritense]|uniref:hypothetical protein n=1 Tax=Mycolicibacterium mageritense TaxID=53462 RepID=UPI0025726E1C|nr:hypothetical protein [Mycolicibacterium mageritense]
MSDPDRTNGDRKINNIRYLPSRPHTKSITVEPRFEVVDSARTYATEELDRSVMDAFGHMEPLDYRDGLWKSFPLRLTHDSGGGWQIECGPFNFDSADVERIRQAIAAYDDAVGK